MRDERTEDAVYDVRDDDPETNRGKALQSLRASQRWQDRMNIQRYATELRTQASQVLEAFPDLPCTWHDGALRIAASGGDGFEVVLQPDSAGIIVFTGVGFHEHCEVPRLRPYRTRLAWRATS